MQNRTDRINFPPVVDEELWKDVSPSSKPFTVPELACVPMSPKNVSHETPVIATPHADSPCVNDDNEDNYFKRRELQGLITPARTPSDILYRGPLYASSSEEDCGEVSRPTSPGSFPDDGHLVPHAETNETHEKLLYHRQRQMAIKQSLSEFTAKMTNLLEWHKEEELALLAQLHTTDPSSGSMSSRSSLRRGRSKLSERLYEAIDLNSG